jgi:uncharacterized protein YggE
MRLWESNRNMKTTILSLFLLAAPAGLLAQTQPEPQPSLTVSGVANLQVAPDRATIRLGVVRQSSTAQSAQDQANRAGQDILDALARVGVPPNQIQTSRLTLSPIYSQQRPGSNDPPRIVAYNASNIVTITLEDLTKIGPALDAGLNAGANRLEGVSFDVKDDLPVRQQALRQAVTEARTKAEAMADALGVRLVQVLDVSEGGVSVMPRMMEQREVFARAAMASDIAATPVSPGQLEVQANVTVRFRIAER